MAVSIIDTGHGETKVETGVGTVMEVKDTGSRNVQIVLRADHLDQPVTGWVDSHAIPVPGVNDRLAYRIDVHRKKSVDPATPFTQLGIKEKVRDIVALLPPDQLGEVEKVHRATGAVENPVTPPPPVSALATEPLPVANLTASVPNPTACLACGGPLSAAPVRKTPQGYVHVACPGVSGQPAGGEAVGGDAENPPPARRPRMEEGRPWQAYNTDGTLNLGSYAVLASVGTLELAHSLVAGRSANRDEVAHVARVLLSAADRVQSLVRADGHVDRMDASHTRARGAVRTVLDVHPVPWDADPAEWRLWHDRLVEHASWLLGTAISLVDPAPALPAPVAVPVPEPERPAVMDAWPNDEAFTAAHTLYAAAAATLSDEERAKVKRYKTDNHIGWPLTPDQHEEVMETMSLIVATRTPEVAEAEVVEANGATESV